MGAKSRGRGQKILTAAVTALLLAVAFAVGHGEAVYVNGDSVAVKPDRYRVVLDAGHGGADPGKIGINGVPEKEVNLQITMLVKQYLEAQDIEVILTRKTDDGLYDEDASNKKVQDMKRRIDTIEEADPVITVSIHQNSYPEEYVRGAQVFYYSNSVQGQKLAQYVQDSLVERVDPQNRRLIKPNDSYYLLKYSSVPAVIVECGFLSNPEETARLTDYNYQKDIAYRIAVGVCMYYNRYRT